jgi:hypothetical protein
MGWESRDYHGRGPSGGGGEYLSNPAAILGYSLPFGTWWGARVRLHFWLLLTLVFIAIGSAQSGNLRLLPLSLGLILLALMLHEFGHRFMARWVGGSHDEFVLWPAGGMVPPNAPPHPRAMFIAHLGGMAMNLLLAGICIGGLLGLTGRVTLPFIGLFSNFSGGLGPLNPTSLLASSLGVFLLINVGIIFDNLLPYYWFDGGYLLQTILWPWTGLHRAINVTCIVGMVLAVPMFLLSLAAGSFLGMVFWVLLFSSSYNRRKQLQTSGTGELEAAIAFSASQSPPRRRQRSGWAAAKAKEVARERREQAKIDAILEKVHEKGMQSLNWFERRALRKATAWQRRRDAEQDRREKA